MAKIRRVVRKLRPAAAPGFDEHQWPVNVALCVLGGFIEGANLAYFYGSPWFWPIAIATPLALIALMLLLRFVSNRMVRRAMQLALVVSIMLHVILAILSLEAYIFGKKNPPPSVAEFTPRAITAPEYSSAQLNPEQRRQQDFMQPVETETPAPTPEVIERQEAQREHNPTRPQPAPVPEPERTFHPNVVKKAEPSEVRPRQSETQSQLSHQTQAAEPLISSPTVAAPASLATAQNEPSEVRPEPTQTARQQTAPSAQTERAAADNAPAVETPQVAQTSRTQTAEQAPPAETAALPTLTRELNRPAVTPRTVVAAAEAPAVAQQTQSDAPAPANTTADKQQSAAPEIARARVEPAPESSAETPAPMRRRELPSEPQPTVAQAPVAVPNQRPRATDRPAVTAVTPLATPSAAPALASAQPTSAAAPTSEIQRANEQPVIQRAAPQAEPTLAAQQTTVAQTIRRQQQDAPTAEAPAAPTSVARRTQTTPQLATRQTLAQAPAADTPSAQAASTQIRASDVVATEQETAAASRSPAAPPAPQAAGEIAAATPAPAAPRRQTSAESAPAATSAAVSAPSRAQAAASVAPSTSVANAPAAPTAAPAATAAQVTPAATATVRQATTSSVASRAEVDPSAETASSVSGAVPASPARRSPQASEAPAIARSPVSLPTPRQSTRQAPSATTVAAADAPRSSAPSESTAPAPHPAAATVARQETLNTSAARSQAAQDTPTASPATQLAQGSMQRTRTAATPSMNPQGDPAEAPARTAQAAFAPTSPTPVDSPASAIASRTAGEPTAKPAELALAKSTGGVAGIGATTNLDRATPAAPSPSQVAAASARRAEAMQNSPAGPDLAPSEAARVSRSVADAAAPSATLAAANVAVPDAAGAAQPSEINASASAALVRRSSDAASGPVSADAGTVEVDFGPTRIESTRGSGRAGGGGQPELNTAAQAHELARAETGGAPLLAMNTPTTDEVTAAPVAAGGGSPATPQTEAIESQLVRTDAGGGEPVSGGPALAAETGPPAEASTAADVGQLQLARAEAAEAAPGDPAAGGGEPDLEEDEEEKARRLARNNASGAPALALGGPAVADVPASPSTVAPSGAPTAVAADTSGGQPRNDTAPAAPTAGGPTGTAASGPPSETAGAAEVAQASANRAAAGGDQPDAREPTAQAIARAARGETVAVAVGSPKVADTPGSMSTTPPGGPGDLASLAGGPQTTATARTDVAGGEPAGGGPSAAAASGPPAEVGGGEQIAAAQVGRAEAAEAAQGAPALGGGTGAPARAASGPALAASTLAETVAQSGAPASSGEAAGIPLQTQGVEAVKLAGGAAGPAAAQPLGAAQGERVIDAPLVSTSGPAPGSRARTETPAEGPTVAAITGVGSPARAAAEGPPQTMLASAEVDIPGPSGMPVGVTDEADMLDDLAQGSAVGPMSRHDTAGLAVNVPAEEGPGGIGAELADNTGVNTRRATTETVDVAYTSSTHFPRQEAGGGLNFNTSAIVSADAFSGRRAPDMGGQPGGGAAGGSGPQTEESVELGLVFLARHQATDGSWSFQNFAAGRPGYEDESAALVSDTAATALALLAFQGAGYNHREHRYQDTVRRAVEWLVKHQKDNGDLYLPMDEISNQSVWLYSHGIAALALCEAYGMTQDRELREPAQKALNFIVQAQHPNRGGWRYSPQFGADTSVTGWMMMALKSGELAGLETPQKTYNGIERWLDSAQASASQPYLYRYNPMAPDTPAQRHGRETTKTMTAVGLLMRLYSGWKRDTPEMIQGADYLKDRWPNLGERRDPQRDTYYWYYATQVMFHMGGDYWKDWNARLHPLLVDSQVKRGPLAGSWNPKTPVPDRWGPHAGRIYVTTMNLLSLEVYYRHLPLYEDTAK